MSDRRVLDGPNCCSRIGVSEVIVTVYRLGDPLDRGEPPSWTPARDSVVTEFSLGDLFSLVDGETTWNVDEIRIGTT